MYCSLWRKYGKEGHDYVVLNVPNTCILHLILDGKVKLEEKESMQFGVQGTSLLGTLKRMCDPDSLADFNQVSRLAF